ncbi:MAG: hypothetical protein HY720_13860 [Planctomycetes bacterium]|nr:hypothetical protein [Planctomycetota bacterium]
MRQPAINRRLATLLAVVVAALPAAVALHAFLEGPAHLDHHGCAVCQLSRLAADQVHASGLAISQEPAGDAAAPAQATPDVRHAFPAYQNRAPPGSLES